MTAEIVDLATRRAERDDAQREDMEVDTYGIAQRHGHDAFELFAELKSGRRVTLAEGLAGAEAWERLFAAVSAKNAELEQPKRNLR